MDFVPFVEWILTAPDFIKQSPQFFQQLAYQFYQTFIYQNRWHFFTDGLKITFIVTIGALIIGIFLGLIAAIIRSTYETVDKRPLFLKILNSIVNIYLTVIRGTPMMVQLLIMGFVIMVPKTEIGTIACGIITLGINSGAYVAEIIRSGLMSINKGQTEAGRSLGLSYFQTMYHIIIPQAIKNILPALGNEMITLLKDTSLVSVIALRGVTHQAQNLLDLT
ncbi:MAG: amino acid ABC transporter permease, partial [Oscillospiraceae bacterium]|nr:amino acid ABC transporter permease [Candidatus Equicaccousia limihippi]